MAKDPKLLLHFNKLADFKAKYNDVIDESRHLVFIKDEKLIWCRGKYYIDGTKLDGIESLYNDWTLTQTEKDKVTITLYGKQWNEETRTWDDIDKALDLVLATQEIAGLLSPTDKKAIDNLHAMNWSHISDAAPFTATTSDVKLNYTCRSSTADSSASSTPHSESIGAASSTRAGVMIAQDKIELDRITTTNFTLGEVTPSEEDVTIKASKLNINTNVGVDNNIVIPAATDETAGVLTADLFTKFNEHYSFTTIEGDEGSVTADEYDDTLTIAGDGNWITTTAENDSVTVKHTTNATLTTNGRNAIVELPSDGTSADLPSVLNNITVSDNHIMGDSSIVIPIKHGAPVASDDDIVLSASDGTPTNVTGSTSAENVVTGVVIDANGHVTGVTLKAVYSTDTTYSVVSNTANGLAPKVISTNASKVSSDYYVLASSNGSANPSWYKLPDTAFTDKDTHYTTHIYAGDGSAENTATEATDATKITLYDNDTQRDSITIAGSGVNITSDTSGTITITAPNMVGATTALAGSRGLVPAPTAGATNRYLCSNGTWAVPGLLRNTTTFWGNNFNGTQTSISGDMSSVGSMSFNSNSSIGTYEVSATRPKEMYINDAIGVISTDDELYTRPDVSYTLIRSGLIQLHRNENGSHNSLILFYKGKGTSDYWEIGRSVLDDKNFNIIHPNVEDPGSIVTDTNIQAKSFTKTGGTATLFLMANGTVNEFFFGHTTGSISSVPITRHLCLVTLTGSSTSATFGLNINNTSKLADGLEVYVIIKNNRSVDVTITLPSDDTYIPCVTNSITIPTGSYGEVSAISIDNKIYLRGAAKEVSI